VHQIIRRLFLTTVAVSLATIALPGRASTPASGTLTLVTPVHEWQGSAPYPNLLGCQPSDPTCDHHLVTVGNDVNPLTWSVAVDIDASDTHVAIYRIGGNVPRVDVVPLGQSIAVNTSTDLTAITASTGGGHLVFVATPGTYDVEVAGTGTPAAPELYRARARLCAGTDCQAGSTTA
jgi:hypothetical protein